MLVETNVKYLFIFNAFSPQIVEFMFRLLGKGLELRQLE